MLYRKLITAVVAVCLAATLLTACIHNDSETELTQINIACFPNITHAQALVMKDQNTLEQIFGDDVEINWTIFNAGPSEIEAMFAGHIDIGYIGPVPALSGYIQSDGDLQIIAGASNGGSVLVVRSDSDINIAADLDSKNVAIPQFGNTQHLSLLALLTTNGLSPTTSGGTVSIVPSSNADVANLMERGDIDAALVPEPWGSILEQKHNARVVLDYDKVDPNGIPSTAVVIVRKDFLDAHPEAVARFISAHMEVTDYINNNLITSMGIVNSQIMEITQQPIDDYILSNAFNRLQILYEIPVSSIMNFASIGVKEEIFRNLPDSGIINDAFIR